MNVNSATSSTSIVCKNLVYCAMLQNYFLSCYENITTETFAAVFDKFSDEIDYKCVSFYLSSKLGFQYHNFLISIIFEQKLFDRENQHIFHVLNNTFKDY